MNSKLLFTLCTLIIFSCNENQHEKSNLVSLDPSESLACNLCLLKDSIDHYNIASLKQTDKQDTLLDWRLKINQHLYDSLSKKFRKENQTIFQSKPGAIAYKSTEYGALEMCMKKYAFNLIEDKVERDQLFSSYVAYTFYNDLPIYNNEVDTSLIPKKDGFYILEIYGKTNRVKYEEFPVYWEQLMHKHVLANTYLTEKKNSIAKKLCGKTLNQMSEAEYAMFKEHVAIADDIDKNFTSIIHQDKIYQQLLADFKTISSQE
ncbi:hypothetical protein [Crocinitomix catalasitica]|uniref:hypothetical protein n=1 Tax=Crocinitomix catalasitica TaxID=184607 RepID=UPI0004885841|nr:hypothetical protein [Crocinitomix catalasitica]